LNLSEKLVSDIVAVSPSLMTFIGRECEWVTDETLAVCAEHCPVLETVDVTSAVNVSAEGICALLYPGNKLKELRLCAMADDVVMQLVGEHCQHLCALEVFDCERHSSGCRVTDVGVRAVLEGCPLLRETDIKYARGISDDLRVELTRRDKCAYLAPSMWRDLSVDLLIKIFAATPQLTELDFCRSNCCTDAALAACAVHCALLKSIWLGSCPALTSAGITTFLRAGNKLSYIDLSNSDCVDNSVIEAIVGNCQYLRRITLPRGLRRALVLKIKETCPNVRVE
jgi:hypothetical protein